MTFRLGSSKPCARNAVVMSGKEAAFEGSKIHGSRANSESASLRRPAHRLRAPATTKRLSSNRTSACMSSCNGPRILPTMRSTSRSRSSRSSSVAVSACTTLTSMRGYRRDSRSMIAGTSPTASASGHPTRTSPAFGFARNSMSLIPALSSSNTTRPRLSSAFA